MTPDTMLETWRKLIADGCDVRFEPSLQKSDWQYCEIVTEAGEPYPAHGKDPTEAFAAAYKAFLEGEHKR